MSALAPHTRLIFDKIASLSVIQPYILVGGTALSLQIHHRLSEDLDFMRWKSSKKDKQEVDWVNIERELSTVGKIESREIWDFNHVEFVVDGVKISFYISPQFSPVTSTVPFLNNMVLADLQAIGAMKLEVLLRRSNFRDYYDIYALLKFGVDFRSIVTAALNYSNHALSTKNLLAILSDGRRFRFDSNFPQLQPIYSVSTTDIEEYLKGFIREYRQ